MSQTDIRPLIAAMRARCNKATPGPWQACLDGVNNWPYGALCPDVLMEWLQNGGEYAKNHEQVKADREFIAYARTDLPRALDALEITLKALEEIAEECQLTIDCNHQDADDGGDDCTNIDDCIGCTLTQISNDALREAEAAMKGGAR